MRRTPPCSSTLPSRVGGPSVSRFAAAAPALLFAVHPVQTEAVTYISGRSVSLMAFFYLGSLLAYLRGRERGSRFLLYLASPTLFLLAAATKEVALTLPFAMILCEAVRREKDGWKEALRAQAVHWGLLVALAVSSSPTPGTGDCSRRASTSGGWRRICSHRSTGSDIFCRVS